MITTVTGKNQITIPAAIANRIGLKSGSRTDWRLSSKPDEIRCIVLPEPSVIAALLAERSAEESLRATHLK